MARRKIVILGAAGRDFHNFNMVYRDNPAVNVVAFTAAQIPGISGRRYPAALAGAQYPNGIYIRAEAELELLCRDAGIDEIVFAYSDVPHAHVMHLASRALACGADFSLLGPKRTMLHSTRRVIAVTAVRTGCGKSPIARFISRRLAESGLKVAVLRHPMPYGDLEAQRVQRFASLSDLDRAQCTIEEREEYEAHVAAGNLVFAGVDYAAILRAAETEADIIVWDGGNNDFPFIQPDLHIAVVDALRPDQIATHHPGEAVARMADILVINKADAAAPSAIQTAIDELRAVNPKAPIVRANSPITLDDPGMVRGKRVIVVEDGPTITHGGMPYGAGYAASQAAGAAEIVDPRASAAPAIAAVYRAYPHIGKVLPAIGYEAAQTAALAATIDNSIADVVVAATPVDLGRLIHIRQPITRARYAYAETGGGGVSLSDFVDRFIQRTAARSSS